MRTISEIAGYWSLIGMKVWEVTPGDMLSTRKDLRIVGC
jgi:hypothetical protein